MYDSQKAVQNHCNISWRVFSVHSIGALCVRRVHPKLWVVLHVLNDDKIICLKIDYYSLNLIRNSIFRNSKRSSIRVPYILSWLDLTHHTTFRNPFQLSLTLSEPLRGRFIQNNNFKKIRPHSQHRRDGKPLYFWQNQGILHIGITHTSAFLWRLLICVCVIFIVSHYYPLLELFLNIKTWCKEENNIFI